MHLCHAGVHRWTGLRTRRSSEVAGTRWESRAKQRRQRNTLSCVVVGQRKAYSENCMPCLQGTGRLLLCVGQAINSNAFLRVCPEPLWEKNDDNGHCIHSAKISWRPGGLCNQQPALIASFVVFGG